MKQDNKEIRMPELEKQMTPLSAEVSPLPPANGFINSAAMRAARKYLPQTIEDDFRLNSKDK